MDREGGGVFNQNNRLWEGYEYFLQHHDRRVATDSEMKAQQKALVCTQRSGQSSVLTQC